MSMSDTGARGSSRVLYIVVALLVAGAAFAVAIVRHLSVDAYIQPALADLRTTTDVNIRYDSSRIGLTGIILSGVVVDTAPAEPAVKKADEVRFDRVVLRPSVWGLVTGRRGLPLTVTPELDAGSATLTLDEQPETWAAVVEWTGIDAANAQQLWSGRTRLNGLSNGRVTVTGRHDGGGVAGGSWEIASQEMTIDGLRSGQLVFPRLSFSRFESSGSWEGRQATVTTLNTDGTLGRIELSGKVIMRTPFEKSALRMEMIHRPPPKLPPELAVMLKMMLPPGGVTRGGTYRVAGTIGGPALSPAPAS
jgi:type II secretion system protein N